MEERFKRFKLHSILPGGSILILNMEEGILSLLSEKNLIAQESASPMEMSLIVALLEAYPNFCPIAVLLSKVTHQDVDTCWLQISNAQEEKTMRAVTKRLREMIVRCRKKLQPIGIDIGTLLGRGYILGPINCEVRNRMTSEKIPIDKPNE